MYNKKTGEAELFQNEVDVPETGYVDSPAKCGKNTTKKKNTKKEVTPNGNSARLN